jgi:bifunctional DNA-binding transcriptional regulator/antitoxin component of YhaV-PrlF toxin-antitoxin module
VKARARGQVTIPEEFRRALGIEAETLLGIALVGNHIEIVPMHAQEEHVRRYTDSDIAQFLAQDKLDARTANRIRSMLRQATS